MTKRVDESDPPREDHRRDQQRDETPDKSQTPGWEIPKTSVWEIPKTSVYDMSPDEEESRRQE